MKVKYFVTATENTKLLKFYFAKHEKNEAIACLKNLSLRFKDAELYSVDSEDDEIVYRLTEKYI